MTVLADLAPRAVQEPSDVSAEPAAVVAVVMDFVGATLPQFDQLLGTMRLSSGGPGLPGSIFQWSRRTSDGVRVTQIWNAYRHFEAFLDREEISLRLSEAGIREPEITTYEVHDYLTQGPTVVENEDGTDRNAAS